MKYMVIIMGRIYSKWIDQLIDTFSKRFDNDFRPVSSRLATFNLLANGCRVNNIQFINCFAIDCSIDFNLRCNVTILSRLLSDIFVCIRIAINSSLVSCSHCSNCSNASLIRLSKSISSPRRYG
ncbi:hypothetical protein DERF_004506 [Dermatophagoides farinae]|uniref:Uncharacterized protein n=1 Tax=Dermatophagoides farinae TaxID=6954 RepID=A0A922I7H3_DERFA|nr:hypothetical protein DERF_004506 [Dermatophagoides farinae]